MAFWCWEINIWSWWHHLRSNLMISYHFVTSLIVLRDLYSFSLWKHRHVWHHLGQFHVPHSPCFRGLLLKSPFNVAISWKITPLKNNCHQEVDLWSILHLSLLICNKSQFCVTHTLRPRISLGHLWDNSGCETVRTCLVGWSYFWGSFTFTYRKYHWKIKVMVFFSRNIYIYISFQSYIHCYRFNVSSCLFDPTYFHAACPYLKSNCSIVAQVTPPLREYCSSSGSVWGSGLTGPQPSLITNCITLKQQNFHTTVQ